MKNKKDVYIIVDTPKKAKKLKKVLDMFGEKIYSEPNHEDDDHNGINMHWRYGFSDGGWQGVNTNLAGHCMNIFKEVSIKELRNILTREHLKEGDVVVVKNANSKWILKITGNNIDKFEHTLSLDLKDNFFSDNKWLITNGNFIRYATEAEKELLRVNSLKKQAKEVIKPVKKELEVGKWYIITDYGEETLIFNVDNKIGYGFGWFDGWTDNFNTGNVVRFKQIFREATHEEVEKALIEEAKRRGFVNGGVGNNSNIHDKKLKNCELFFNNEYEFDEKENLLRVVLDAYTTWTVFKDGKWASIIEQDKFAELKEAHRNGAVIQFYCDILEEWCDCYQNTPSWDKQEQYRIKPEEKLKVGDLVKAWDNDERDFVIGKLKSIDDSKYPFELTPAWFKNAKKITHQEALDLLTENCR